MICRFVSQMLYFWLEVISMDDSWLLLYDEANEFLTVSDKPLEGFSELDSFLSYDDALDALTDVRAICADGVALADVVHETYGSVNQSRDELPVARLGKHLERLGRL